MTLSLARLEMVANTRSTLRRVVLIVNNRSLTINEKRHTIAGMSAERPRLAALEPSMLREQALESLREAILTGDLPPGTRLREIELSRQLGISRGTVREAILRLAHENLVVMRSHRGAHVRKLTAAEVRDIYTARACLEEFALRLTAARSRDEIEAPLRLAFARFEAAQGAGLKERVGADLAFHESIWILSGNSLLPTIWQCFAAPLRAAILSAGDDVVRPLQSVEDHRQVVDAILAGDRDGAARLIFSQAMAAGLAISEALAAPSALPRGRKTESVSEESQTHHSSSVVDAPTEI